MGREEICFEARGHLKFKTLGIFNSAATAREGLHGVVEGEAELIVTATKCEKIGSLTSSISPEVVQAPIFLPFGGTCPVGRRVMVRLPRNSVCIIIVQGTATK